MGEIGVSTNRDQGNIVLGLNFENLYFEGEWSQLRSWPRDELAYLQTGIKGILFRVLNLEHLYFKGEWSELLYFLAC